MPEALPGYEAPARHRAACRGGDAEGRAACFHPDALLQSAFAPSARGRAAMAALQAQWVRGGPPAGGTGRRAP